MKNVRVWFEKDKQARFISHLDLNRCMLRAINASKIKIWHTEGFNPHPFVTFALPLPLGVKGVREAMDMRLLEDCNDIPSRVNKYLPEGIRVLEVKDPELKPTDIAFARYEVSLDFMNIDTIKEFLAQETILVEKKTKSSVRTIDLKKYIDCRDIKITNDSVTIELILPAGSKLNISPILFVNALFKFSDHEYMYFIVRRELLTEDKFVWR